MIESEPTSTDDRVIVIGSGPCGAMAADRLVERGVPVVMLDAGLAAPRGWVVRAAGNTLFRSMDSAQMVDDRHERSETAPVDWYSSRTLGGLSNYWTAAVPRFAPSDFDDGARLDERYRWPIGYDDLEPFYAEVERRLVVTAGGSLTTVPANVARYHVELPDDWRAIAEAASSSGHDSGPIPMAKGRPWMVARRGTEFGSYHCIVAPLLDRPNFTLVSGAMVTALNWSSAESRVSSVDYVDRRTGVRLTIHGRAVVLAAGAIDSPTILLRSTSSDFPTGLGNSTGLIGSYLHDHPREWWTGIPSRRLTALAHPVYVARSDYESSDPLMATSLTIGLAARTDRLRTYVRGSSESIGVQVFGTMVPRPEVGITLPGGISADDPDVRPKISLRYDSAAIDNLHAARSRIVDYFRAAGEDVRLPGPFHPVTPGSSVHFAGAVRMHEQAEFGALDRWNRLRDVGNVVVCDSSCFTTGPEKNPTLTSMAIAARAADHLADELGVPAGETRS